MPMYDFHCGACDRMQVIYRHISAYNDPAQCQCGEPMARVILPPAVMPDLPGYVSPVTGKWVEGKSQRREDLRRSGCRPYEKPEDERKEAQRQRNYDEAKLDNTLREGVAKLFYALPEAKRRLMTRG